MLDNNILLSRPRPPARKSLSHRNNNNSNSNSQPPNDLADSPLSTVAKILQERSPAGIDFKASESFIDAWSQQPPAEKEDEEQQPNSITHEWVGAKTREELESLLLAADRVIRERERDLGIAAAIGQSLLQSNIALRGRQKRLLAEVSGESPPSNHRQFEDITNRSEYIEGRPPPSPSDYDPQDLPFELSLNLTQSPTKSTHPAPPINPEQRATPAGPAARFPHCLRPEVSPRSSISSISSSRKSTRNSHLRHQQPASASPATLHRLAQQNEYLAEQLAELQAETAESELEGRKRLRKLVKELDTLRADLQQTEERNALLEEERLAHLEQENNNVGEMVEEIVGDMKRLIMDDHDSALKMRTPTKSTANFSQNLPSIPIVLDETTTPSPLSCPRSQSSSLLSLSPRRSTISNLSRSSIDFQSSPQERALVSQLLNKIAELKESQSEFDHEREEMKAKLRKAREEVEELQLLVEDAESELQQVKQLAWDDRRGMIEWDGEPLPADEPPPPGAKSARKASGNRKMIQQSRKAKKRQWPAPEHQPGSLGSDITIPESNPSLSYDREPSSPSMRGQALSRARLNPGSLEASPESQSKYSQLARLQVASMSSFQTLSEGDESIRSTSETPLRTLLSEIGGLYPEEASPEATSSPIVNGTSSPNQQDDKKYGALAQLGPPPSRRIVQQQTTYTELQRAVAETPLAWADETPSSQRLTTERKRDSTEWLYSSAASYQLESWSASSSATLGLMSASRPKPPLDALLRQRQQLLIQGRRGHGGGGGGGGAFRFRETSQSSTLSSSTTVGRMSPSERTTTSKSERSSSHRALRRTSRRRQEALRRLGIPSSTDTCSYTSECDSSRGGGGGGGGDDEDGSEEEDRAGQEASTADWNYIDATDHDHLAQGATGTDYYPISVRARNAPAMVVGRLQAKSAGWGTFVYQWMKLVSVVGLAVGWAVWQGPRSALDDDFPFGSAHNARAQDDHHLQEEDEEEEGGQRAGKRLAIEHPAASRPPSLDILRNPATPRLSRSASPDTGPVHGPGSSPD
ncbi:hypothetical protein PTTG_26458 [Puccinia triticina 1-1 BBBD Race 1]|uniref:Uncharacterized protein n=1 Tax=Puccinia triticina (isolate 1-1 / race 1 (BBBD)) TaxID=630390 RepID=A0A180GUV8_PUCT1|nr:hypothetical protein PTTG_26458 [Puccinia triticina 1-1 BBBD Race 1]